MVANNYLSRYVGVLLMMTVLVSGCWGASPPTPTPKLLFVTATPSPAGAARLSSPTSSPPSPTSGSPLPAATPTASPLATALPPPTAIPSPTFLPTSTLIPATPTPTRPYAVVQSPSGFLNVRSGPGEVYGPPLGTYNNGVVVDISGKQYSRDGELWWLIPFVSGPYGQGWIFAGYTTGYNLDEVPWVAPPRPPPTATPTLPPIPHAIIDSPDGFVFVRRGPGLIYEPPLGTHSNGRVVDLIGKQFSLNDELWWLIPFAPSPNGQGWIYAKHTIARYTRGVPWVTAPPTPTATPSASPTHTPTVPPPIVTWRVNGRVVDADTTQPVANATVNATLGNDGTSRSVTTDGNGQFNIMANAQDVGELSLIITAAGYTPQEITAGPTTPRFYNFPVIELTPEQVPPVTWTITGRVTQSGTTHPISGAEVEAILGDEAVRLNTSTNTNGEFSASGQARDAGLLTLTVTAAGYQPHTLIPNQTAPRSYNFPNLQLLPVAGSCRYESVLQVNQSSAISRLQSLGFTSVVTQPIDVSGNQSLVDIVITQEPEPPPPDQLVNLDCAVPITLGVGVEQGSQ